MIISFINQKGGVGKSTLAFNFAGFLSRKRQNKKVLLIDADPQQSLFNFLVKRKKKIPFKFISKSVINKKDYNEYNYVFVDCGGYDSEENRSIIENSDIVVIPVPLAVLDIESSEHIFKILKKNNELGFKTKNLVVINMVSKKEISNEILNLKIKKATEDYPVKILETYLTRSVEYNNAFAYEESIFENEKTSPSKNTQRFKKMILEVIKNV